MRVPALLERYALSICSADFNEWIRKNVSVDSPLCYMFGGEYEMPEFDLGQTFNYAEMAGLITPRPFMVQRRHGDGGGNDEWGSYEYGKVRRLCDAFGIPPPPPLPFFHSPHTLTLFVTF